METSSWDTTLGKGGAGGRAGRGEGVLRGAVAVSRETEADSCLESMGYRLKNHHVSLVLHPCQPVGKDILDMRTGSLGRLP